MCCERASHCKPLSLAGYDLILKVELKSVGFISNNKSNDEVKTQSNSQTNEKQVKHYILGPGNVVDFPIIVGGKLDCNTVMLYRSKHGHHIIIFCQFRDPSLAAALLIIK